MRRSCRPWGALAGLALSAIVNAAPASAGDSPRHVVEGGTRLPEIVARVLPAVVSITTREIADTQFNRQVVRRGLGSGFIIDPRGYILTNHHVVEGAPEIKVALADGRRFLATLVGADRFSDLAVLKIDAKALPVLRVGDSRRLRVAETVIAIGNPLWLEGGPTVTVGIVSALGRSMEEDGLPVRHDLVQTDAAINPGNSGGPLIDVRGRVVGINTAIVPSAHGIGFAISIDQVKPIVKRLLAGGRVERASPGFAGVTVTPQLAWANDLAVERGVLVTRVDRPDGAPGVVTGDIVTAVDGESIATLHQLHDVLARHRAGETVELTVRRAAAVVHLRAVLEAER